MEGKTKKPLHLYKGFLFIEALLVGVGGFEPLTPCTPCRCATRLRYTPSIPND